MVEGGFGRSGIGPEPELTPVTGGAIERGPPDISFPCIFAASNFESITVLRCLMESADRRESGGAGFGFGFSFSRGGGGVFFKDIPLVRTQSA